LLNGKVGRLGAFKDPINVLGGTSFYGDQVRAVGNEAARLHKLSRFIDRRKAAPSREVYDQFSVLACKRVHEGEQRIAAAPLDRRKDGRKIN
jgi:Ser/Thr protein kinase RdoA (MazF antagonist)